MVSLFWKIAFHIIIIVHTRLRKMNVPQKCRREKGALIQNLAISADESWYNEYIRFLYLYTM